MLGAGGAASLSCPGVVQCNDEKERLSVTKLLARMFSDKNSDLASHNPPLWNCFLGRWVGGGPGWRGALVG